MKPGTINDKVSVTAIVLAILSAGNLIIVFLQGNSFSKTSFIFAALLCIFALAVIFEKRKNTLAHITNYSSSGQAFTGQEMAQKNVEVSALESERRYQTLAEICPVGIFHTEANGYTTYVNPGWCQISGMPYEQALGNGWLQAVHPDDKANLISGWTKATEVHEISLSEYRFVKPDGTIAWVIGQAVPEFNSENIIVGYVGTITDITDRKKAEEAIKKANDRFEMVALATNDAVFELDLLSGESWYNQAFLNLFNGSIGTGNIRQDVTQWISRLHPEDKEKVTKKMEASFTGLSPAPIDEFRFQKADGSYGIFYDRSFVTRDLTGKPIRIIGSMTDITELKKAEQQLIASEEKYRILFYNNPMPSWVTGKDSFQILDANDAAVLHYGYSREDFLSMNYKNLMAPGEFEKYLASKQSGEVPPSGNMGTWHQLKKDGTLIDVEVKVHDILYNGIACRITLANDVTEQRKAQEAFKKANERFEFIAKATNDVIWDWNGITDELWWNDNYYQLFGYDPSNQANNFSWGNRIHPDDRERVLAGIKFATNSGQSLWQDEYRYLKSDGEVMFIYDRGFILHDEQGKPYRMMGSMLNVTELKKAQDEIIKEKNLSDKIINSLPGIFYLYNKEGKFLRWNKNFEKVTLYNAEEISHLTPLDLFDVPEKDLIASKIAETYAVGEASVQAEFIGKTKVKTHYYFTGKLINYENNPCVMGVGLDFSERIQAQEKIQQASEQLRQLALHLQTIREEERKRIGREIHDELGQQLTAMKMDIAWIDKKIPEESAPLKNKLKNVIQLLDGSNQSIRRILSELRSGVLEDHGLLEAVQWLGRQFTANTGIPVEFTSDENEITSSGAVANCIFRACQEAYTNITRYARASKVSTSLNIIDDKIRVMIEDDGIGFDAAAKPKGKSFGILGMQERVLSLKGKFELISSPGNGTKIIISLPKDFSI